MSKKKYATIVINEKNVELCTYYRLFVECDADVNQVGICIIHGRKNPRICRFKDCPLPDLDEKEKAIEPNKN